MQAYTELVPPTAITHALALPFLSPTTPNLIVAKTSLLQIFALTPTSKLRLIGEYPLAGTVTSLARVKTSSSRSGGEALLLSFRDAKLSLVEWDPENHRLSTISIHYYEGENVVAPPYEQALGEYESVLTVDPGSRCAALKFGARQVAILPFRQGGEELIDEDEEKIEEDLEETPYKASFVLPLTTLDPSLCHTVHLAFLFEYREPTFGILSAAMAPSAALFEERRDCLTYTVFTLDLEQKASTNLMTVGKLPSSLWKVVPLPLPIGGALLVGNNEFVHVDQSGKANATAVNEFAKRESEFGMADQSHLNLKLEHCCIELLDPKSGELLLVLNDGSLATINFQMLGRSISSVDIAKVSPENGGDIFPAAASCITRLDNDKLFIGSEDGASSLLAWSRPVPSQARKRSHAQMLGKNPSNEEEEDEDITSEDDDDDDDLYDAAPESKKRATSTADPTSSSSLPTFEVKDTLNSIIHHRNNLQQPHIP
jgi:cleavage and polyadenylation specificity factor subunit 1